MLEKLRTAARTPLRRRRKARMLIDYGRRAGLRTLVETGTYRGHTVAACAGHFDRIYTIELDPELHAAARRRFAHDPTITTIHGDSCEELLRLVPALEGPALFWLDAHFSSGVTAKGPHDPPLEWELRAILARGEPDVVLIDDARLLGLDPGWPSLEEVRELVAERTGTFEVDDDVVRVVLTAARPSALDVPGQVGET